MSILKDDPELQPVLVCSEDGADGATITEATPEAVALAKTYREQLEQERTALYDKITESLESVPVCRFCQQQSKDHVLVKPCKCRGRQMYVHPECLVDEGLRQETPMCKTCDTLVEQWREPMRRRQRAACCDVFLIFIVMWLLGVLCTVDHDTRRMKEAEAQVKTLSLELKKTQDELWDTQRQCRGILPWYYEDFNQHE